MNYYSVLQVERQAGLAEIKRAFRRLLKRYHPDRNRSNAAWAEQRTREIVEAYHVLSDERRRRFHDQQLSIESLAAATTTNGTPPPNPATNGVAARCRQLFDYLLRGNSAVALDLYENLRGKRPTFDLYPYLTLKDHLDCKFLLGEAYEQRGQLDEALALYEEVFQEELEGPRLRYFFDEVQERIVTIYCQHLARSAEPHDAVRYFQHALKLGLPHRDRAEIRKRLAETLLKTGDRDNAARELREAIRLHPGIKGVQRLATRLGIQIPVA